MIYHVARVAPRAALGARLAGCGIRWPPVRLHIMWSDTDGAVPAGLTKSSGYFVGAYLVGTWGRPGSSISLGFQAHDYVTLYRRSNTV